MVDKHNPGRRSKRVSPTRFLISLKDAPEVIGVMLLAWIAWLGLGFPLTRKTLLPWGRFGYVAGLVLLLAATLAPIERFRILDRREERACRREFARLSRLIRNYPVGSRLQVECGDVDCPRMRRLLVPHERSADWLLCLGGVLLRAPIATMAVGSPPFLAILASAGPQLRFGHESVEVTQWKASSTAEGPTILADYRFEGGCDGTAVLLRTRITCMVPPAHANTIMIRVVELVACDGQDKQQRF